MQPRSPVATEVDRVFKDDLAEVADRVRKQLAADDDGFESFPPTRDPAVDEMSRAALVARDRLLAEGAAGLERLAEDPAADLTPSQAEGLEAIVLLEGRPALLVLDGDFRQPPAEWSILTDQRGAIKESIARVGRIEVVGHPSYEWVGTGFLVGPDLVMTNRHVAVEFASRGAGGWTFTGGRTSSVDLLREAGNPQQLEFDVVEVVGVHGDDRIDLALLRVEPIDQELPTPLRVAAMAPEGLEDRSVYVVGYPAWDGRRNEPEAMRRIFADVYNVKRLQPGRTMAAVAGAPSSTTPVRHDCSTLGGNSGSPVFDLEKHAVIGLHFGGKYGRGNSAVPLWELVDDPLLAGAGINFSDANA